MTTIDDFVVLVRDELGLDITAENVGLSFDELPGWDSLHLLSLAISLERAPGRPIMLPDLLEARSLEGIYSVAVAP
jgi:hypothetical protein